MIRRRRRSWRRKENRRLMVLSTPPPRRMRMSPCLTPINRLPQRPRAPNHSAFISSFQTTYYDFCLYASTHSLSFHFVFTLIFESLLHNAWRAGVTNTFLFWYISYFQSSSRCPKPEHRSSSDITIVISVVIMALSYCSRYLRI